MARSEPLRATAIGVSREDAVAKLKEAILEMVNEFGEHRVRAMLAVNKMQEHALQEGLDNALLRRLN
jgi:hypothetical protein